MLIASDIDVGSRGVAYADEVARYLDAPVVTVTGNHEAYHGDVAKTLEACRAAAAGTRGRVAVLEDESVEVAPGVHVLGCTLWTDYALHGATMASVGTAMSKAARELNDHAIVRLDGRRFEPGDALRIHQASRRWLHEEAARVRAVDPGARIVVVTHHAPIPEANEPQYRNGGLSPAPASDMREDVLRLAPVPWASGHTHHGHDLWIGSTRLVSAQRGYVGRQPNAEAFRRWSSRSEPRFRRASLRARPATKARSPG